MMFDWKARRKRNKMIYDLSLARFAMPQGKKPLIRIVRCLRMKTEEELWKLLGSSLQKHPSSPGPISVSIQKVVCTGQLRERKSDETG
jgi:hypothetical protein